MPASAGRCLDTGRAAVGSQHPGHPATGDDPGSAVVPVLKEREQRGSLAAERAPVLAPAASLLAARSVAGDEIPVIAKGLASTLQCRVVLIWSAVMRAHIHPPFGDVEAALEGLARRAFEAMNAIPLVQHLGRSAERVAPVDDGAAAKARAGQYGDPEVGRREQPVTEIKARGHLGFVAGEV